MLGWNFDERRAEYALNKSEAADNGRLIGVAPPELALISSR
jgi:hypothetical protein